MKKIIVGVFFLIISLGVLTGTAMSVFTSSATVTNLTITSGNAELLIGPTANNLMTNWDANLRLENLYPGYGVHPNLVYQEFFVQNNSTSNIALDVLVRMTTAPTGMWNNLSYATQLRIDTADGANSTGWISVTSWYPGYATGGAMLPGGSLAQGETKEYRAFIRVAHYYGWEEPGYVGGPAAGEVVGNEIAGQTLENATFTFLGMQHL